MTIEMNTANLTVITTSGQKSRIFCKQDFYGSADYPF
ncbi:hypothetical protein MHA_1098 [Mannheimia haemolytica PHL213]|nr:hypothetical protein MHA_1098 [Mannheimia haemolytica PHL213]